MLLCNSDNNNTTQIAIKVGLLFCKMERSLRNVKYSSRNRAQLTDINIEDIFSESRNKG